MLLWELFDSNPLDIVDGLRDQIMDVLTPFAANKVPYVSVDQIIDRLHDAQSGMAVDRALVVHVLDPAKVKMVKSIEGDRVYLDLPNIHQDEANEDEKQKNANKVKATATKQAKKQVDKPDAADTTAKKAVASKGPLG